MTAHYVYRAFDAADRCLYVGCTKDLPGRLKFHAVNSPWPHAVVRIKATVHPTKAVGRSVERDEIRRLDPAWNVMHRWANNPNWSRSDFDQYLLALRNRGYETDQTRSHGQKVEKLRDLRFPFPEQVPA